MTPQTSKLFKIDDRQRLDFYLSQFELDDLSGHCLLDVGCGDGYLLRRLGERAKVCVGFDKTSRTMWIPFADNVSFLVSGFDHSFPFRDETFDLVFMVSVLEHFRHARDTFEETVRVLKSGGRLCIQAPNRYCPIELYTFLPLWGYLPGERLKKMYVNLFRPERDFGISYSHQDRFLKECRRNMVMEKSSTYVYPKEVLPSYWDKWYDLYEALAEVFSFIAMGKIMIFRKP